MDSPVAGAPRKISGLAELWADIRVWRWAAGVFATLSLALLVAAIIARDPPDFSDISIVAVVRDGERHPVWAIRLARAAHQIAADTLRDEPAPPGRVYQAVALGRGPDRAASTRPLAAVRAQAHCRLAGERALAGRHRGTRRYARTRRRVAKSRADRPAGVSGDPRESGLNSVSPRVNF